MRRAQAEKQVEELNKRHPDRVHFAILKEKNDWVVNWQWRKKP